MQKELGFDLKERGFGIFFAMVVCVTLAVSLDGAHAEESEAIQLEIKYTNGDRADYNGMKIMVYQDFDKSPILEKQLGANPETITVPENHRYKIKVYANGMYADVVYVQLNKDPEKITSFIPLSGGLQFQIFYKNGHPINGATVVLKSQNNEEWRTGVTNDQGETLRYWVQSTTLQENHYVADVYLGEIFLTSYFPIKLQPGIATDQKITTLIPEIVEELITINLFSGVKKITSSEGNYNVRLMDLQGNAVSSSEVDYKGDAHFSNLKSGTYVIKITAKDTSENALWPQQKIHIIGDLNKFSVFRNNEDTDVPEKAFLSCNCVAFRLDGIQDYWLNEVQIKIMSTFVEKKAPLTIGIISNAFGNDQRITDFVKQNTAENGVSLEVATKGVGLTPYTNYDRAEQNDNLKKSIESIQSAIGVRPHVLIPPDNKFNKDTLEILEENQITHISGSLINGDSPPFEFKEKEFYRFPQTASTGKFNPVTNIFDGLTSEQVIAESIQGIEDYGFAVISIQPQEFATVVNSTYVNAYNEKQIYELKNIIDGLNEKGYRIVPVGKIDSNLIVPVPSWIKNNAGWWANGEIDDETFAQGIEYLIQEKIIKVSAKPQTTSAEKNIPSWVKNNAGWWANGDITDETFVQGIEYLVKNGIIPI